MACAPAGKAFSMRQRGRVSPRQRGRLGGALRQAHGATRPSRASDDDLCPPSDPMARSDELPARRHAEVLAEAEAPAQGAGRSGSGETEGTGGRHSMRLPERGVAGIAESSPIGAATATTSLPFPRTARSSRPRAGWRRSLCTSASPYVRGRSNGRRRVRPELTFVPGLCFVVRRARVILEPFDENRLLSLP